MKAISNECMCYELILNVSICTEKVTRSQGTIDLTDRCLMADWTLQCHCSVLGYCLAPELVSPNHEVPLPIGRLQVSVRTASDCYR